MFVPKIRQGADPEYGYFDGETTYVIFKDGTLARTYFSSIDAGFKTDSLTHEQDETELNPGYDYIIEDPTIYSVSQVDQGNTGAMEKSKQFYIFYNVISAIGFLILWIYLYEEKIDILSDTPNLGLPGGFEALLPFLWIVPDLFVAIRFNAENLPKISIKNEKFPNPRIISSTGWFLENQLNKIHVPKFFLLMSLFWVASYIYASILCVGLATYHFWNWSISKTGFRAQKNNYIKIERLDFAQFTQQLDRNLKQYSSSRREKSLSELIAEPEGTRLEFKSSVWATYRSDSPIPVPSKNKNLKTEDSVVKTIAAFLNTEGGKLIIGIHDRPSTTVVGIERDFEYSGLSKNGESFLNSLSDLIKSSLKDDTLVGTYVKIDDPIETIQEKMVCVVNVHKRQPKYWTYVDLKDWKGKPLLDAFFVRSGPQSKLIPSRASADEWKKSSEELRGNWQFSDD